MMKKFNVWYSKHTTQVWDRHYTSTDSVFTAETHELVAVVYCEKLNDVFDIMNGADYGYGNPNPLESKNAQTYLQESDAAHTSMSVGDVVVDGLTGTAYWCDSFGWHELT